MELHDQEPNAFGDQGTADLQDGSTASSVASRSAGRVLVADEAGVVVLPAGTELGDIQIEGRDLVVIGADGVRYVIPDGAIIVPQLVIDDVAIPPLNLAALLIGNEPQPAAGNPQSSGGNFAGEVDPLQAAYALGDLLPYTELAFSRPQDEEVIPQPVDRDPTIIVITVDQPAGVQAATATVAEAGLPARNGEPAGSNAAATTEATTGTIVFSSPDGVTAITINGTTFTGAGQTISSPRGTLQITSFDPVAGTIGFTYTLTDNLVGATLADEFVFSVTDPDGDVASASLTVSALDDAPTARADTDSVAAGSFAAESGNVITAAGTTSGAPGADTVGADNATISRVASNNVVANVDTSFDAAGNLQVSGQYGTLLIKADGSYSYTRATGTPGGVTDAFTYTLTDSDGSASTATLTISIADAKPVITSVPPANNFDAGTLVFEAGLPSRPNEAPGTNAPAPTETTSGKVTFAGGDGPVTATINGVAVVPGATVTIPGVGTLTVSSFNPVGGELTYTFTLADNTAGDNTGVTFNIVVTDVDGDTAPGTFTIAIRDDSPTATSDMATQAIENAPVTINVLANDLQGADSVQPGTVTLVSGSLSGAGALVNNGDGSFTYTPAPGEKGPVTFDYSITDGDGDTSTAKATIALIADSEPQVGQARNLSVDEDGLANANPDMIPLQANPAEVAGGANLSDTGTVTVNFSGDIPANLAASVALLDDPAYDGQLRTLDGNPVIFALESGVLVGRDSAGAEVIRVAVTDAALGSNPGEVIYTYSTLLSQPVQHPAAGAEDSVTLSGVTFRFTDLDGDSATGGFTISFRDDVPTAALDTGGVTEGATLTVLAASGVLANDTAGADGFAASGGVVGVAAGSNTATPVSGGLGGPGITGTYGTLTLNADGSYTYVATANRITSNAQDTFVYTIADGDGDLSTTTLTINVANVGLDADNQTKEVAEAALDTSLEGSDLGFGTVTGSAGTGSGAETVTGALNVTGTGVTYVAQNITTTYGLFNLNANGTYTYTLTKPYTTSPANNDGAVVPTNGFESLSYTAQDGSGNTVTGMIRINILDDVPTAALDTGGVTEGATLTVLAASGVLANDTAGADGFAASGGVVGVAAGSNTATPVSGGLGGPGITGTYGTLTLNADGSYTYVATANRITSNAQDTFVYTIADGDGDLSTTTLTINVANVGLDADNQTKEVAEAALDTSLEGSDLGFGTVTGSAGTGSGAETVTGALNVTGTGVTYVAQNITTTYGLFNLNANGTYTYTLTKPYTTSPANNDGAVVPTNGFESLSYTAQDGSGNTVTGMIRINILDDVPTAALDTGGVTEGATLTVLAASGVLANDTAGADGFAASGGVVGVAAGSNTATPVSGGLGGPGITGTYGTLTLNADGSYTYVATANRITSNAQDTFVYTIADGDGDLSTTTLTINVANVGLDADNQTKEVAEAALDTSLEGSDLGFGTVTGSAGTGSGAETVTGALNVTGTGVTYVAQNITTTYGLFNLNANGTYTYTLTKPYTTSPANNDGAVVPTNGFESLSYTAQDGSGNTVTGMIRINILDDVPTAALDTGGVTEGATLTVLAASGVLANDTAGADGFAASGGVVGVAAGSNTATPVSGGLGGPGITGTYGTLTLNADGSYTYVATANRITSNAQDTFVYTIADGDGDLSTTTLTINVANVGLDADNQTKEVAEAALDTSLEGSDLGFGTVTGSAGTGSGAETVTGALNVTGTGVTYVAQNITTTYGLFNLNANGTYTYTLTKPYTTSPANNDGAVVPTNGFESLSYTAQDGSGNTVTGMIRINILDDVPTAALDTGGVTEGATLTVLAASGVLANDTAGADGFAASGGVVGVAAGSNTATPVSGGLGGPGITGTYGTLTLNADGSYTYVATANRITSNAQDTFVYTIADGDGDLSTTTLTINVANVGLDADNQTKEVAEAALDTSLEGSDLGFGTVTGSAGTGSGAETVTGALNVTGTGVTYVAQNITTTYGLFNLNANGTYTYTLTKPYTTSPANNDGAVVPTNGFESLSYTAQDGSGNTVTGMIRINILDDVPTAALDTGGVTEGATLTVLAASGVLANDTAGADGFAASGGVVGVAAGSNTATPVSGGLGGPGITGTYGTLTLNADGSYTYVATANRITSNAQDTFVYTIADGDGDLSTTTLTINVANVGLDADNQTKEVAEAALDTATSGADLGNGTITGSNPPLTTETATGTLNVTGSTGITYVTQNIVTTYGLFKLNADGTYTYTLTKPYTTTPAANDGAVVPTGGFETLGYTAMDANGNSVGGTVTITIKDDVPTAVVSAMASGNNATGTTFNANLDAGTGDGDIDNNYGADGGKTIFTAASIASLQSQNLSSGLSSLNYTISADGTVLTATKVGDASLVFIITLDPLSADDKYVVSINQPLDSISDVDFTGNLYQFVGGNTAWAGFVPTGEPVTGTDNNSKDLLLTPAVGGANASTINQSSVQYGVGSANSIGLGTSNNPATAETFRLDFVTDLRGDSAGSGTYGDPTNQDHVFDGHYQTNGASVFFTASNGTTLKFAAFDDYDGNTAVGDGVLDAITGVALSYRGFTTGVIIPTTTTQSFTIGPVRDQHTYTITANSDGTVNVGGLYGTSGAQANGTSVAIYTDTTGPLAPGETLAGYNSLQFTYVSGDEIKVGNFGATIITNEPVNFTVPFSLQDGDGDITPSGNLSVRLNPVVPPIALDLDGDGFAFISLAAGTTYDYGSGLVQTAWVGGQDGLLAIDLDGDGTVSIQELTFGGNGMTDLEGLAAQYDANHDGVLDANDADFAKFGVWQDANGDGLSDPGEFRSLSDAGIVSISLVSDGQGYTAAGGDVTVFGSSTYTRADGTTGALADAAFATRARDAQRTAELVTTAAVAGALIDGIHAAAQPAAAEFALLSGVNAFTPVLSESILARPDGVRQVDIAQFEQSAPDALAEAEVANAHIRGESTDARMITGNPDFDHDAPGPDYLAELGGMNEGAGHGASLFAAMGTDGMMDALLVMAPAPAAIGDAQGKGADALAGAMADFAGEAMIDGLLDRFAPGEDGSAVALKANDAGSAMLTQDLGGSAGFALMTIVPEASDDASMLAAAQA